MSFAMLDYQTVLEHEVDMATALKLATFKGDDGDDDDDEDENKDKNENEEE